MVGGELAHARALVAIGSWPSGPRANAECRSGASQILFFDNDAVYSIADQHNNTTGIGRDNWRALGFQ